MQKLAAFAVAVALFAAPALAIHPGTELFVSAASRGPGVAPSVWITDLYIYNPNDTAANVTIYWLVRGQANTSPTSSAITVGAGQTAVLEDIIKNRFSLDSGNGAFRIVSDVPVMANAAILNKAGGTEFGQGFEGIPVGAAIAAGAKTSIVALKSNADYRTNLVLIDASGSGSSVTVHVVDPSGVELAQKTYTLGAYQPVLESMTTFGAPAFQDGTVVAEVSSGAAIVGASRINQTSGDPLTLDSLWPLGTGGGGGTTLANAGIYYGLVTATDGSLGGLSLTVIDTAAAARTATDTRAIQSIDLEFPSTNTNCSYFFSGGGTFDTPVAMTSALSGGIQWTNSYGSGYGKITWTLQLTEVSPNLNFTGTLAATGSAWPLTYIGCNADLGTAQVDLGKKE